MKENSSKTFWIKVLGSILILFFISTNSSGQEFKHYKLSADDVVAVNVYDEPELSLKESRISSAGTITMPLIGQINVKGLSIPEAEKKITELYLGDYLKNPDISITIIEYRQFYINGEVNKPGGYSFREGMTVQRAITLAGGFTERAARERFLLIRENSGNQEISAELTTPVEPGDVITVEESFF